MAFMMRFRGISAMHVDLKMPNGCELLKNQDHDHKMPLSLKKKKPDNSQNFALFWVAFHFKR